MKKLIILFLILAPIITLACEEMYWSREGFCLYGYDEPCNCGSTPCTYIHRPSESYKPYLLEGKSCRACAANSSKYWMYNNGDGWERGKCGQTTQFQDVTGDFLMTAIKRENLSLVINPKLIASSKAKAQDMASNKYFSHTSPSGEPFYKHIIDIGYIYSKVGEILAVGQTTATQVVNGWMNSSGHRAIITGDYKEFGCSYIKPYSVCHFGSPATYTPPPPPPPPPIPDPIPEPIPEPTPDNTEVLTLLQQILTMLNELQNKIAILINSL